MKFEIKGKRIILRNIGKCDANSIYKHANDKKVFRYTTLPYPYTKKDALEFIPIAQKGLREQTDYELGIAMKDEDSIIGMIALKHIDRENKLSAEIGYWLGVKYWRQGITSEAAGLMLDFAFYDLNLNKVFAKVMEPNQASVKLLQKLGFKKEGFLRKHEKRNGVWMNVIYLGLLKKEYKK
ncbi:GNAT family N-acetyltransferase [Candidatus Falkowbacteria bacterium]|nr:GNAT family N-acetyltransferase [Candidatus Falkowbacteria bacterium]